MRYFHRFPDDEDPAQLLDPDEQWSTPWGGADHGPCDKCEGRGRVPHRCLSCHDGLSNEGCPACRGRVSFTDRCPACEGSGEISRTRRRGVSAFPTREGLYRYLLEQGAELEGFVVVELDAELSGDVDLDADRGAVLVLPREIVAVEPIDDRLAESLRTRS